MFDESARKESMRHYLQEIFKRKKEYLPRTILLGRNHNSKQEFCTNKVVTTKYTIPTFLPRNLIEQFSRVANIYFLLIVILQIIPATRSTTPFFAAFPLLFILSVTAIKDGIEDFRRFVADKTLNKSKAWLLHGSEWVSCLWETIRVGDIVRLNCDDSVPADLVLLHTTEPSSVCYTETKSLDGETNLKLRRAAFLINSSQPSDVVNSSPEAWGQMVFSVNAEPPSTNLYVFNGTIAVESAPNVLYTCGNDVEAQAAKIEPQMRKLSALSISPSQSPVQPIANAYSKQPLNAENLLMRGCLIRNTESIVGVVVYTGMETKIMMNSGKTPSKISHLDRLLTPEVLFNFFLLFLMCLSSAILTIFYGWWPNVIGAVSNGNTDSSNFWGIETAGLPFVPDSPGFVFVITFFSCLVTLQNIVPISLYISFEFVKSVHALFIFHDKYLVHNDVPCMPKRWNISDDLGCIKYVFTDKTGTLTRNIMEFKKCFINDQVYTATLEPPKVENPYIASTFSFFDQKLYNETIQSEQESNLRLFWEILAVCHTVVVKDDQSNVPNYSAQSPDEAALVSAARDMGFVFLGRNLSTLNVWCLGMEIQFELLHLIEFNSSRKRMSVIVKSSTGKVLLFTKGADTVIFKRLRADQITEKIMLALDGFGSEGLRTLCLAYRELNENMLQEFNRKYKLASTKLENRDQAIEEVASEFEQELILVGASAVEDKLQDGVPDTIHALSRAKIHIWMLTGDKTETAINIGYSCNLITIDMPIIIISGEKSKNQHKNYSVSDQIAKSLQEPKDSRKTSVLVIDGDALTIAFDPSLKEKLLELCLSCNHVICCRVSPLQKAQVVALVRKSLKTIVLAIGDGANDVSMIQEADIGIGIFGEEGMQAALSSDYAIGQFKHLLRLLLLHGRWSNIRSSKMVVNFFYKNIVWVGIMYWFQYFSGFSATLMYDYTYLILYNLIFTVFPVLVMGVFEKDVEEDQCMNVPEIYTDNHNHHTKALFFSYVLDAIYQSLIVFFVPYFAYNNDVCTNINGYSNSLYETTGVMALACISVVNIFISVNMRSINIVSAVMIFLCSISLFIYTSIYSLISSAKIYYLSAIIYSEAALYFTCALVLLLSLLPRICGVYLTANYFYNNTQIIKEMDRKGLFPIVPEMKQVKLVSSGGIFEKEMKSSKRRSLRYNARSDKVVVGSGFAFSQSRGVGKEYLHKKRNNSPKT